MFYSSPEHMHVTTVPATVKSPRLDCRENPPPGPSHETSHVTSVVIVADKTQNER